MPSTLRAVTWPGRCLAFFSAIGPVVNFFSPRMGNAQRLPNGNTLINEASFGRLFEVTREGDIVWEYVNPFFGGSPNAETNESSGPTVTAWRRLPGPKRR